LIAAVVVLVTAPIQGTSLLLTGLEIYMIVHLARGNNYKPGLKEIGYSATQSIDFPPFCRMPRSNY
jgi:hypothetical protein